MKKSLYIYLSSLLGVLLFLILHRLVVFAYLLLASLGYQPFVRWVTSLNFLALDYITLVLVLMLGAWYGIWVGLEWYKKIYENGTYPGLVGHIADRVWPKPKNRYDLRNKIGVVEKKLKSDMAQLESLAQAVPAAIVSPEPIKRRVIRKRAPRALTKMTKLNKIDKN